MIHAAETRDDVRSGIVETAAQLLRDHGAASVTTRRVAEAAGVQAPTIYRLFGDKGGLIDAVAEHVMAAHVEAKATAAEVPSSDPVEDLCSAWRMHLEFGLTNPELYALLNTSGRGNSSPSTAA